MLNNSTSRKSRYIIDFGAEELSELLELFKNAPKWKSRIATNDGFWVGYSPIRYLGCADSGFCFNCNIIVGDPICFCSGGPCPKCGNHVNPRDFPENMNGIYEKHSRGLAMVKQRYENGEWKETIKND